MNHFTMAATTAVLLVGLLFYTLAQAIKQYDTVYQSNDVMIILHKLEYSNAEDDSY